MPLWRRDSRISSFILKDIVQFELLPSHFLLFSATYTYVKKSEEFEAPSTFSFILPAWIKGLLQWTAANLPLWTVSFSAHIDLSAE